MKLFKICAWWLLFMAALHTVVGLALKHEPLVSLIRYGAGAMDNPHNDRLAALWFHFSGGLMFVVAGFSLWSIKHVGRLPGFLGWACLIMGLIGGPLLPASGFWLYIPVGAALVLLGRGAASHSSA